MKIIVENYLNELFGFGKKEYDDNLGEGTGYLFFANRVKNDLYIPASEASVLGLVLITKKVTKMYDMRDYRRMDGPTPGELNRGRPLLLFEFTKKIFPKWDVGDFFNTPKYIDRAMKDKVKEETIMGVNNSKYVTILYIDKFKFKTKESKYPDCINYIFHGKYLNGIYTFQRGRKDQALMVKGDIEISRK